MCAPAVCGLIFKTAAPRESSGALGVDEELFGQIHADLDACRKAAGGAAVRRSPRVAGRYA
jgi:hypothetical protein